MPPGNHSPTISPASGVDHLQKRKGGGLRVLMTLPLATAWLQRTRGRRRVDPWVKCREGLPARYLRQPP